MTAKQSHILFNVAKNFQGTDRITREGGERLRLEILKIWKQNQMPIILDLMNEPIASIMFWDEGIAKLLEEGWNKNEVKERLKFKNIHSRDEEIIKKIIIVRE